MKQINRNEFEADVEGTETYHVHLDIAHPRISRGFFIRKKDSTQTDRVKKILKFYDKNTSFIGFFTIFFY